MSPTSIHDDERDREIGDDPGHGDAAGAVPDSPEAQTPGSAQSWRERVYAQIEDLARSRGRVIFDGEWLAPDQVKRHLWRLRWQSLRMILETVVLCAFLVLVAGILWLMLVLMGG